jgi:predicted membrane protein
VAALRALAVVFAVIAVACMIVAIAGMATGRQSDRTGWLVRVIAVVCFGAAVGLNVAAH